MKKCTDKTNPLNESEISHLLLVNFRS